MEILYTDNLLPLLLSFLLSYTIGHIAYGFLCAGNSEMVKGEFLKNILGLWIIIGVYSIVKTGFFTINLGFLIIAAFLLLHKKIMVRIPPRIHFPALLFQFGMLLLFYTVFYLKYYNPLDQTYHALFSDFPGYAAIVEKMNSHGLESRFPDYLNNPPVRELYHYGDLWLSAFFSLLFKKTALTAFYFIMFPLITMVFSLGLLALINPVRITYQSVFLGVVFLFVSTLSIFFPKSIAFFNTEWGEFTMLNSPKRTIAGLVVLSGAVLASGKHHFAVIVSLLVMVCVYTISAPVVFVSCSVYIAYLFLTKQTDLKQSAGLFLPLLVTGVFLMAYIKICADINEQYLPADAPKMVDLSSLTPVSYITTAIKSFAGLVIKLILGVMLFAALFFRSRSENKPALTRNIVFILLVIISGYTVHSLLFFVAEANQLYTVTYIPAIAALVVLLLAPVYDKGNSVVYKLAGLVLVIICFYQNLMYSDKYENKVEREINMAFFREVAKTIPHDTPHLFGSIQNADPNKTEWANFNIYYPYDFFKLYFDNYNPIFLSLDNLKPGSLKKNHIVMAQPYYIKTSSFYKFLQKERRQSPDLSFNDGMLNFITSADIKYLIISPGSVVPPRVSERVVKTIEDQSSGYRLCILK